MLWHQTIFNNKYLFIIESSLSYSFEVENGFLFHSIVDSCNKLLLTTSLWKKNNRSNFSYVVTLAWHPLFWSSHSAILLTGYENIFLRTKATGKHKFQLNKKITTAVIEFFYYYGIFVFISCSNDVFTLSHRKLLTMRIKKNEIRLGNEKCSAK